MKITKSRLKQIIKEELEAVISEEEEEEVTEGTEDEPVEEVVGRVASTSMPPRGPSAVKQRVQRRQADDRRLSQMGDTPTLDAAADALGMSPSQLMMDLAREMGVELKESSPLDMPPGE